jgi:two-component sensor histidine kinase
MNMEDLYRLLRSGHVQAQGIVDTVEDPLLVLDRGLCVLTASRAFFETFRVDRDQTIGYPLYELGNGQWDIPELRRLLGEVIPKAAAVLGYEIEHEFPEIGRRTMLLTARRLQTVEVATPSMLLSIVDVTDRRHRETARDMHFGELRHRMQNLLGLAQSIARQTTTQGRTAEEYRDAFLGRFGALVEAQELAFSDQTPSDLEALSRRILAPYTAVPEAVEITPGPPVALELRLLQSLGLVLHELATNAAKHGALSMPGGKVRMGWQTGEDGLRLHWTEEGGSPVSPPDHTGYGTQLLEAMTTYSLGGQFERDYAKDGLRAEILIPLATTPPAGTKPAPQSGSHAKGNGAQSPDQVA